MTMHCLLLPWQQWAMVALHSVAWEIRALLGNGLGCSCYLMLLLGGSFHLAAPPSLSIAWSWTTSCSSTTSSSTKAGNAPQWSRHAPLAWASASPSTRIEAEIQVHNITHHNITTAYELPVLEFHILDSFESDVLLNIMDRPQLR